MKLYHGTDLFYEIISWYGFIQRRADFAKGY